MQRRPYFVQFVRLYNRLDLFHGFFFMRPFLTGTTPARGSLPQK
jgi:hypothetical protein